MWCGISEALKDYLRRLGALLNVGSRVHMGDSLESGAVTKGPTQEKDETATLGLSNAATISATGIRNRSTCDE